MKNTIAINKERDVRVRATACMWVSAVPLLYACVPIVKVTSIGILCPLVLLIALTIGTASVWFCHGKLINAERFELKQLQDRIANLEDIVVNHEDLDNRWLKSLEGGLK